MHNSLNRRSAHVEKWLDSNRFYIEECNNIGRIQTLLDPLCKLICRKSFVEQGYEESWEVKMERDLRTLRRSKVCFAKVQAYLIKLRINACEKIEKHSVCMIFLIKRTTWRTLYSLTWFSNDIPGKGNYCQVCRSWNSLSKTLLQESVRLQFSLSGGFVTFLERFDLAVK